MNRLVPLLLLATGGLALAQPVSVNVETRALDEGRPGAVRVVLTTGKGETRSVLLTKLSVSFDQGGNTSSRGGNLVRFVEGVSVRSPEAAMFDLDGETAQGEVISLELRAIDDPGAAARAPMPDTVSTVKGERMNLVPFLARRTESLRVRPMLSTARVNVSWEAVVIPKKTPKGIYQLEKEQVWRPEGEDPRKTGPRVLVRLMTRHWGQWTGDQRSELLLRNETLSALPVYRGTLTKPIRVRSARFGLRAAIRRANMKTPLEAWRLPDDRWILQHEEGGVQEFALVGSRQPVIRGEGDLSVVARELAEGRSCEIRWGRPSSKPELATLLRELFSAQRTKSRGLRWSVDAKNLAPYLEELGQSGFKPVRTWIR